MNDYGDDRGRWFQAARQRVQAPGLLLQIFGIISLFLSVLNLALLVAAPEVALKGWYDAMANMQKNQPGAQPLPPFEDWVKSQRMIMIITGVLQLAGSVVMFLGGTKMKQLQGYGLAMAGSIMATIPLCTNQCCCISLPFGIWALAVLLNPDVKLAFTRSATMSMDRDVPPDDRPIGDNWEDGRRDDDSRRDDRRDDEGGRGDYDRR